MGKIRKCCICSSNEKQHSSLSFHKFPKLKPEIVLQWKKACNLDYSTNTSKLLVCSKHFTQEDFSNQPKRKRLKSKIVPSLLLPERLPTESGSTFDLSENEPQEIEECASSIYSSSDSGDEIEDETDDQTDDSLTPEMPATSTNSQRIVFVEDYESFSTPRGIKRNFSMMTNCIKSLRDENNLLKLKNRTLQRKIETLENFLVLSQL